jgi:hypothetical protein
MLLHVKMLEQEKVQLRDRETNVMAKIFIIVPNSCQPFRVPSDKILYYPA